MPIRWERWLIDPIRSRLAYDLLVAYVAVFGLLLTIGRPLVFGLLESVFYAVLVLLNLSFLGIYSTQRTAGMMIKLILLVVASVIPALLLFLMGEGAVRVLIASAFFVWIFLALPRIFFNLGPKKQLVSAVRSTARVGQPVLVIGGGGYIGTHVVEQLLKAGFGVRVLDTFYYGKQVLDDLRQHHDLEVMTGDVTDMFALTQALNGVQAVVHLAGIVGDPACSLDDELTRHLNIVTTRMVKEQVKALGIPRFVFASSCSVYGSANVVVNESSQLNPVSLYAKTKIDSEREILQDPYDEFHPTVLRFATVFGHSRRMRFDLVTNLFTAQAYYHGLITVKGSGQWRPFVSVSDIARAIVLVLGAPLSQVSRQVFNVGDDSLNTTIGDLAELTKQVVQTDSAGKLVKVKIDDSNDDPRNYHVAFGKIRKQLGFGAEMTLSEGIEEMHRHMMKGTYKKPFSAKEYSNLEMTKLIQKEFHTESYKQNHFSLLQS